MAIWSSRKCFYKTFCITSSSFSWLLFQNEYTIFAFLTCISNLNLSTLESRQYVVLIHINEKCFRWKKSELYNNSVYISIAFEKKNVTWELLCVLTSHFLARVWTYLWDVNCSRSENPFLVFDDDYDGICNLSKTLVVLFLLKDTLKSNFTLYIDT